MAEYVEADHAKRGGKMKRQPSLHSMEDNVGFAFVPAAMAMRKDYDVHDAVMMVKHAWAAYMDSDSPGTCSETPQGSPPDGSFDVKGGVRASLAKGLGRPDHPYELVRFVHAPSTDTQAYVAKSVDESEAIMAIRGSTSLDDFIQDSKFLQTVWEPDDDGVHAGHCAFCDSATNKSTVPMVHYGFYQCLLSIRQYVQELVELSHNPACVNVDICGHSLGAAIAQMVFAYFLEHANIKDMVARGARLTLFGIGQPRVGNKAWVGYIHHLAQPFEDAGLLRVYRLIDNVDLICSIPPMFKNYSHFGEPALYLASIRKQEKVLMMGTKCDRPDHEVAQDFGVSQKEMEKGLAAVSAATCFACFQRTTRWMYNPTELLKDHLLTEYLKCAEQTAKKFEEGKIDMKAEEYYADDDENIQCPASPLSPLSPLSPFGVDASADPPPLDLNGNSKAVEEAKEENGTH